MSTPSFDSNRDGLIAAILRATNELAGARAGHAEALAARLGLAASDVEVLRLLADEGAIPVGRIGEVTGLTTGATTRMVDRLEQAGFVRRVPDPGDRRRISVEPVLDRAQPVARSYDTVDLAAAGALDGLDDAALTAIHGYLRASVEALREAALPVDRAAADVDSAASAVVGAPVASATTGRLVFVTGAPAVSIGASASLGTELYRARFRGAIPSARVRDGVITIRYPRFAWFDWRARVGEQWLNASAHWKRDTTELQLNAALGWSVELRGGATSLKADLGLVRLSGLELAGGAGSVSLVLGPPTGVVPIRIRGGVGEALVARPAGVAARVTIAGNARVATLDGEEAWSTGELATRGIDEATDRYEIHVAGGANAVRVSTR